MRADVIYELSQTFYEVLYLQDLIKMSEDILERRTNNVGLVELRFDAGREHKGSLLRIKAFARQAAFDLAQAQRQSEIAKRNLIKVLGLDSISNIGVIAEWKIVMPFVDASRFFSEVDFKQLTEQTPEVRIALAEVRLAKENIKIVNANWYPTFKVSSSVGRSDEDFFPSRDSWQIAAGVSMPIFTGGSRYFDTKAAHQDWRQAEYKLFNTMRFTKVALEEALVGWQNACERVAVQQDFQVAAKVRAEIARTQYSNGLLSFQDWDSIENDLIDKEKALLSSKQSAILAVAKWRNLIAEEPYSKGNEL
jgi:outer membrane protein TolC